VAALRLGFAYFAVVFACGFLLGVLRTLLLEPRLGADAAELIELPVMTVLCWVVARRLVARRPLRRSARLLAGIIALACLLSLEFTVVLALQGRTLEAWAASRASPTGAAWALSMALFALFPALAAPREPDAASR
jgi:hypothetical protein